MKYFSFALLVMSLFACGKLDSNQPTQINQVITNDSSSFNGKLLVTVYDQNGTNVQPGATVSLYVSYDDLTRNFPLNKLTTETNTGIANFGYLLNGNYYLCAKKGFLSDTSMVQVLGQRSIQKSMYLK